MTCIWSMHSTWTAARTLWTFVLLVTWVVKGIIDLDLSWKSTLLIFRIKKNISRSDGWIEPILIRITLHEQQDLLTDPFQNDRICRWSLSHQPISENQGWIWWKRKVPPWNSDGRTKRPRMINLEPKRHRLIILGDCPQWRGNHPKPWLLKTNDRSDINKLDDGWPESVEEQGLLLLVWRHHNTKHYIKDVL